MSLLLIISAFNLNKKKPLFNFKIVIFEFVLYKLLIYNIEKNDFFFNFFNF